jgi:hypothetical protein
VRVFERWGMFAKSVKVLGLVKFPLCLFILTNETFSHQEHFSLGELARWMGGPFSHQGLSQCLLAHFLVQQSLIGKIRTFFMFFLESSIFNFVGLHTPLIPAK